MENWKQAIWLAKFELKASPTSILKIVLALFLSTEFFAITFSNYLDHKIVMFDIFFIMAFGFVIPIMKPKVFQYQKVGDNVWASPNFLLLYKLPISKDVLIKSRFIIYFAYSIPFHILLLCLLYLTPSFREAMSISTYIPFSIIWFCFAIYFGCSVPASDAGDTLPIIKHIIYIILLIAGFALVLLIFYKLYGHGIVYWTMNLADQWPVISALVSLLLAFIGFQYWQKYMLKSMEKRDYFK